MKEEIRLKPCPFCGSEAHHVSKPEVEIIECTLCHCKMVYEGSGSALIAMWNTRSTDNGWVAVDAEKIAVEEQYFFAIRRNRPNSEGYYWETYQLTVDENRELIDQYGDSFTDWEIEDFDCYHKLPAPPEEEKDV